MLLYLRFFIVVLLSSCKQLSRSYLELGHVDFHVILMSSLATIRGRSVSQTVSRVYLTAEVRVRSHFSHCRICAGQTYTWAAFFPEYVRFSLSRSSHQCPISLTLYGVTRTWLDTGSSLLHIECQVTFVPPCVFLAGDFVFNPYHTNVENRVSS